MADPSGSTGMAGHNGLAPAQLAKGALRRLAQAKLEPTPANFARAYAEEAGEPPPAGDGLPARAKPLVDRLVARATDEHALRSELASALMEGRVDELQRALDRSAEAASVQAQAWATLIDRLARALERGSRQWTPGRKKESLQRVLDGSRSDALRLQQRLQQLVRSWEDGTDDTAIEVPAGAGEQAPAEAVEHRAAVDTPDAATVAEGSTGGRVAPHDRQAGDEHPRISAALGQALHRRVGWGTGSAQVVDPQRLCIDGDHAGPQVGQCRQREQAGGPHRHRQRGGQFALEQHQEAAARRHRACTLRHQRLTSLDERLQQARGALAHHPLRRSPCDGAKHHRHAPTARMTHIAQRPREARLQHQDAQATGFAITGDGRTHGHSELAARAAWS